jgi:hypothetical protein
MKKIIIIILLLLISFIGNTYIDADISSGYLGSTTESNEIAIKTNENPIYAIFTWDEDVDLWVRIIGQSRKELADMRMKDHNIVKLTGTGKFTLEVYSKKGTGVWFAKYMNELEYHKKYGK